MSRTQRFFQGLAFGFGYQVIVMITGLWMTPFLLRNLGQETLGVWLSGAQALAYLALLDLGVVAMLPREIAFASGLPDPEESRKRLAEAFSTAMRLSAWQTIIVAVACAAAWLLMPVSWNALKTVAAGALVLYTLLFPLRACRAALEGLQETRFLGIVQLCGWTGGTVLTVLLVAGGWGIRAMVAGWCATMVITTLACAGKVWLHHRFLWQGLEMGSATGYLSKSVWLSVSQVAHVLVQGTDLLITGAVLGPAATVVYSCTGRLPAVLANQPQLLMQVAVPGLTQVRSAEGERAGEVISSLITALLLLTGAAICAVLSVNRFFVQWWVGSERFGGFLLTGLVCGLLLLRHVNLAVIYSLFTLGFERRLAITGAADGIAGGTLAYVLMPLLGLAAVPVGFAISCVVISLIPNAIVLSSRSLLPEGFSSRITTSYAIRMIPPVTAAALLDRWFSPSATTTIFKALTVFGLYAALMWPLVSRASLWRYLPKLNKPILSGGIPG